MLHARSSSIERKGWASIVAPEPTRLKLFRSIYIG